MMTINKKLKLKNHKLTKLKIKKKTKPKLGKINLYELKLKK